MAFWQPRIQYITPVLKPKFIQLKVVPKIKRYCSTSPVGALQKEQNRFTVLSSLSSCVGAPHPALSYEHRIIDDPFLSSLSVIRNQEYLDAMTEGESTAKGIMKKYEKVFESHSMWMERWSWEGEWIGGPQDVPHLIKWYKKRKGKISKDENKKMLLFFGAYGSDIDFLNDLFQRYQIISNNKSDKEIYESYVVGLLNCQRYDEAFEMYQEMCSNNMIGSLYFYNKLLSHVCDARDDDERWELAKDIVNRMETVKIAPDTLTFNYLTHIASKKIGDPLALWIDLIREMQGKYDLKPSLSCYVNLLRILKGVSKEDWLQNYAPGILKELEDGNIDMRVQHPDDLLFFTQFMEMLNTKITKQEVDDLALLEMPYNLRADLLQYVIDNELEELTDNAFFLTYFLNFIFVDPDKFSMDFIYEEYSRIAKYLSPPDGRVFRFMFERMLDKKHINYLPQVVKDLRKTRTSYEKHLHIILKVLLESGGEVTGNHKEYLRVLEYVYNNMNVTTEIISQCIYCLCVWGEQSKANLKLDDCINFALGSPTEVLEGALLLSQQYRRDDITQELLCMSKKHGLEVTFQMKDEDVVRTEMTLTLPAAVAGNLASKLGCSNSLPLKGKSLTGVVLSRTKGKSLIVDLGLKKHPDQLPAMIRRSELPPKGMDYVFSSDIVKGQSLRVGDRIQCSIKEVLTRGSKVFLVLASPRYFN